MLWYLSESPKRARGSQTTSATRSGAPNQPIYRKPARREDALVTNPSTRLSNSSPRPDPESQRWNDASDKANARNEAVSIF